MTEQKITEMPELFDATAPGNEPNQGGSQLPPGKHPVTIVDGEILPNSSGDGHRVVIVFKCESGENAGVIQKENFNLWHSNEQTVKISRGKYSALCHATGTFGVKNVTQFFGKRCMLEVVQDNKDPQYTKIRTILNADGTKPGAPANGQQMQQQQPQGQMMGQNMMGQQMQQPMGQQNMMGQNQMMNQQPQNMMNQQPQGMGMTMNMPMSGQQPVSQMGQQQMGHQPQNMMQQPMGQQMQQPQGQQPQNQQPNMQSWGQMQQQQQPQGQAQGQAQGQQMQNGYNQQQPSGAAPWGGQ